MRKYWKDFDKVLEILKEEIGITKINFGAKYLGLNRFDESDGAPQGSALGPKLFSLTQPLFFKKYLYKTSSFADDSKGRKQFALSFQYSVLRHNIMCMDSQLEPRSIHDCGFFVFDLLTYNKKF